MEEKKPKVSVIVPVYNAERFLDACIDSILTQDYDNIELILINDGSTDRSGEICEACAAENRNVIYRYQGNAGVSTARNHGLDLASGEYIAFVDSDDRIKPNAISLLLQSIQAAESDLCICAYDIVYSDRVLPCMIDKAAVEGTKNIAEYFSRHFLEAIASSIWGKLYKKELIMHRFKSDVTMGEDLLFNLEYVKQAGKVNAIPVSLYLYNRQNENSLATNYKISYYEQGLYVCKQWLEWVNQFDAIDDVNIHYHISRAYFHCLMIVCSSELSGNKIDTIKAMSSEDLFRSIRKSIGKFNLFQKMIFKMTLRGNFRLVLFAGSLWARFKKLR